MATPFKWPAPDTTRSLGQYIFRITSPSNHFPATNLLFNVTSPAYAQSVQGAVINNSTNIPFALVALTQMTSSGDTRVIAGAMADAAGNYSIPGPPGNYTVPAFRAG